jgi:hypothetical protein
MITGCGDSISTARFMAAYDPVGYSGGTGSGTFHFENISLIEAVPNAGRIAVLADPNVAIISKGWRSRRALADCQCRKRHQHQQ